MLYKEQLINDIKYKLIFITSIAIIKWIPAQICKPKMWIENILFKIRANDRVAERINMVCLLVTYYNNIM